MKKNFIKTGKILISCICALLILCSFMAISAGAASDYAPDKLSEFGQKTLKVYRVDGNAPKQDGVINANEYGEVLSTLNHGDDWSHLSLISGVPNSVATKNSKLYMTYDSTYIYIGVVAEDPNFFAPYEGLHIWEGDYLEVDILKVPDSFSKAKQMDKVCFAMASGKNNVTNAYFQTIPTYAAEHIGGIHTTITNAPMDVIGKRVKINVKHSGNKTTYEVAMPISVCFEAGLPQRALFYYQHGIANEGYQHTNSQNGTNLGVIRLGKQLTEQQKNEISSATGEEIDYPQMYTVLEFTRKAGGGGNTSSTPSQGGQTTPTVSKPTTSVPGGSTGNVGGNSNPTVSTGSVAGTTSSGDETVSDVQNSDVQSTTSENIGNDDGQAQVGNQNSNSAKKKTNTILIIVGIAVAVIAVGLWIFAFYFLKRK